MTDEKLVVVVEAGNMDADCIYDILQECRNHGKVLEAYIIYPDRPDLAPDDLMFFLDTIDPCKGKC